MGDVVNLKRFRKKVARKQAENLATENRAHHGRTKTERDLDQATDRRLREKLDQHRIGEEEQ
jgi:hypothetical protein